MKLDNQWRGETKGDSNRESKLSYTLINMNFILGIVAGYFLALHVSNAIPRGKCFLFIFTFLL